MTSKNLFNAPLVPETMQCDEVLMESTWEEGFYCHLPKGHSGPHADFSNQTDVLEGTDDTGREYEYGYVWRYK